MKIPDWMILDEMKHTEHYRMYAEVFGIYVPLTTVQLTGFYQGTHRTPSAPRRFTRLTLPAPVPTVGKADGMILQYPLQLSLVEHKSREEQERKLLKIVPIPRSVDQNIPDTRLEPRSDKESPEVEITNVVIPVNVNEEEEEITDEVYELKRRKRGRIVEESRGRYGYLFEHLRAKFLLRKPFDTLADHLQEVMVASLPTMVDKHIKEQVEKQVHEQDKVQVPERGRLQAEISSQIQQAIDNKMPSLVDASVRNYMSRHILHVHPAQPQTTSIPEQQYQLYLKLLVELLPFAQEIRTTLMMMLLLDNSAKRQKASEYKAHVTGESSEQVNEREQSLSSLEVSLTINEAKLKKIADEMLRQRCTSGDEHQYHIDQMKNFLKSTIVWESRKEILASPHPRKTTPLHRYGVEHWKNSHAKIFYIKRQKEPGKLKEVVYSNSKIIQVIKTYWELGHEHKLITEIVARRANECIVSITESDYKNLNKNDIEDIYLLIMNGKELKKHKIVLPSIYEPVHGIIYKNSKKEKRVMRHLEIHKFFDATLIRVLEGLKSYNNDVKYGYVQRELMNDEVEYLKLFEEEIEVRLKYRNQMRRWEIYVMEDHLDHEGNAQNNRPLGGDC
ncbi:hypothetical protein Tco_0269387 [Tanacetum coccineum]